jgi:cytosine permease
MTPTSEAPARGPRSGDPGAVDSDYPIDPVPREARKSLLSLTVILLGFTFFTPTMLAGAQIGVSFDLGGLLAVLAIGSLALGLYVAVLGFIGARTGLTTVVMSRYALGNKGSKLASLLLGGTQVGWYGVAVAALADLTAQALGWQGYEAWIMVVGGALMGLTAYYGYRGMYALSIVSVPLMFVLAFWVVNRSLQEVGGWSGLAGRDGTGELAVAAAVTIELDPLRALGQPRVLGGAGRLLGRQRADALLRRDRGDRLRTARLRAGALPARPDRLGAAPARRQPVDHQ